MEDFNKFERFFHRKVKIRNLPKQLGCEKVFHQTEHFHKKSVFPKTYNFLIKALILCIFDMFMKIHVLYA